MKKTIFVKNAAYLTASSLVLRFAGIVFKIWLAAKIGAEGMGLYQLVFSVYILVSSFAQSGIPTAVTRLTAEESALGNKKGIKRIVGASFTMSFIISAITAIILFFGAEIISKNIISDSRAVMPVRILAVSVFFTGASSVLKGYFIGRRTAAAPAVSGVIEQFIRIAAIIPAVKLAAGSTTLAVAAVFAGDAASELFCFAYLYLRYRFNFKRLPEGTNTYIKHPAKKTAKIAFPLCAGRYIGQLLRTAENMIVPRALSLYSKKGALSLFGMIKGMALPVLFFPSAVLGAVSTLLVPEMSEARESHKKLIIRAAIEQILSAATFVGILFSAIFAATGYQMGFLLYKSADVGFLLVTLSPIVPLMYIDSLCDGLLRGLDQQNFCFRVSVGDSAIRIVLILLLVNKFGIKGFIGIMYFSNLLTCALNVKRLIKISGAALNIQKTVMVPALSAFSATFIIKLLIDRMPISNLVYIILLSAISSLVYVWALYYFDCINFDTLGRMRTHKKYAAATTKTSLTK